MKGKISKIKNTKGELALPITTVEAVYMEDGTTKLSDEMKDVLKYERFDDEDITAEIPSVKEEIDGIKEDISEINSSLDNIAINVKSFGFVGDGQTNNDNSVVKICEYIKGKENIELLFPNGVYVTTIPFIFECDNIIIKGNNAKIIKNTSDYGGKEEKVIFNFANIKNITVEGLEFEHNVIDKDTSYSGLDISTVFYHIHATAGKRIIESVNISNNKFIDNVNIPNIEKKPYNGQIWIGSYENKSYNIKIYNNIFEDAVGRVIYTTNSENVFIYNNFINNLSVLKHNSDYNTSATFAFRCLSSKNVHIYDNIIIGTSQTSHTANTRIFELASNDSEIENIPSQDFFIHHNVFYCNSIKDLKTFNMTSCKNITIDTNTIYLSSDTSLTYKNYLLYSSFDYDYSIIKNIEFINNKIYNPHVNCLGFDKYKDNSILSVLIENNNFYSDTTLSNLKVGAELCRENNVIMRNNKNIVNGIYSHNLTYSSSTKYYIVDNPYNIGISQSTYNNYIVDGVLTVPKNVKYVNLTSADGFELDISDITINGLENQTFQEITLIHHTGNNPGGLKLKYSNSKMRLKDNTDYMFSNYSSITLVKMHNGIWYQK